MAQNKDNEELFAGEKIGLGILSDEEITSLIGIGKLIERQTFDKTCLEGASYDIRVGARGILSGKGTILNLDQDNMEIEPGSYAGILSYEKMMLPENIIARIGSKRALSYDGVILLTGAMVDPGYTGHLLFGLYNASQKRVVIRHKRKICNVVFERLREAPKHQPPTDQNLLEGEFPDAFLDKMANMEVLSWMKISERVGKIEEITRDIIDLKARYEDVLKPIADLTKQTEILSNDVKSVADTAKQNNSQIQQLTASLHTIVGNIDDIKGRTHEHEAEIKTMTASVARLNGINSLVTFVVGVILTILLGKLLNWF